MTIEEDIITKLKATSAVTDLVGTRITPVVKKPTDSQLPAITITMISATRFPAMGTTAKNVHGRYQISVWARNYSETRTILEALKTALQRFRKTAVTPIEDILFGSQVDFYEDDTKQYHLAIDVEIFYIEV